LKEYRNNGSAFLIFYRGLKVLLAHLAHLDPLARLLLEELEEVNIISIRNVKKRVSLFILILYFL
jgi:hypothetical protein